MNKISADYIYTLTQPPIKNGVVVVDDNGTVVEVLESRAGVDDVEIYQGIICPGFVNTHCHLELSYLKDKVATGTGIADYILAVQKLKSEGDEVKLAAIEAADKEMIENGIVAVGDISNTNVSFSQKLKSEIKYHTFIEVFGFNPDYAQPIIEGAKETAKELIAMSLDWSIVPHSPYSVSEKLFDEIMEFAKSAYSPMCVHNQESEAENEMFLKGTGNLIEMKKAMGTEVPSWKSTGNRAIETTINNLASENNLLLVHNTFTNVEDMQFAQSKSDYLYWCMCPNANMYIEGALPDVYMFEDAGVKITLGTDSLGSNYSLSILDEMKTISKYYNQVTLESLLTWGCKNGAEFLGHESSLGTIEVGKKPGLNLISGLQQGLLTKESRVTKLQ
ncbi:MAG: amidohydrolase family protein [Flavobacteriales bacterium]|nr:amidohydrolase family protein [Flavobacteriales bacterium]